MKRTLFILSFILLHTAFLCAQIVIDRSDFPHIGDLVVTGTDQVTPVSPGNSGPNQTWDFSNLVISAYDSALFIPVNQAVNWTNHSEANMASHTLNPENGFAYGFYKDSGDDLGISGMEVMGELMPGFNIALSANYITEDWFKMPYHYGDEHSFSYLQHSFSGIYSNGTLLDSSKAISHVNEHLIVDAWGTMITPTGSFPVLRAKVIKSWIDSTYSWTNNNWQFQGAEPYNTTTYKFFGKNYGLIGQIDMDEDRANGMSFFISETLVNIDAPEMSVNSSLYPNPASDLITVDGADIKKIEIYNLSGKLQLVSDSPRMIDIKRLNPGMYLVKVYTSKGIESSKFVKL